MDYIKKNEWVRRTKGEIRVYETLINALETLSTSELVKTFNGKRVTKTQVEKLQPLMPEHIRLELRADGMFNNTIDIYIHINMDGLQDPKTLMYDHFYHSEKIYQYHRDNNMPVYLGTDRIFNYDNFIKCVQNRIENFKKSINDYRLCVANINKYQKAYAKMEKVITETINSIPHPLKQYIRFSNPILDD